MLVEKAQKKNTPTQLVEHVLTGHIFNFDETRIIGKQSSLKKKLTHEMINIKKNEKCV